MRLRFSSRAFIVSSISVLLVLSFAINAFCAIGPFETGGDGTFSNWSWRSRGTKGYTTAYSSMWYQGKVNSFYVNHIDHRGLWNTAEYGWSWIHPQMGNAPLRFMATMQNSVYYDTNINWFTPGTTHHYLVTYWGQGGYGQRWRGYWDGQLDVEMSRTWLVDGWSHVSGERTTNCSNNGEYWGLGRHNGTKWVSWSANSNWDWFTGTGYDADTDSSYRYILRSNTEGWIRSGNG